MLIKHQTSDASIIHQMHCARKASLPLENGIAEPANLLPPNRLMFSPRGAAALSSFQVLLGDAASTVFILIVRNTRQKNLHNLNILHNLLGFLGLEFVTVLAGVLEIQHIVGVAQTMSSRPGRVVQHQPATGIA